MADKIGQRVFGRDDEQTRHDSIEGFSYIAHRSCTQKRFDTLDRGIQPDGSRFREKQNGPPVRALWMAPYEISREPHGIVVTLQSKGRDCLVVDRVLVVRVKRKHTILVHEKILVTPHLREDCTSHAQEPLAFRMLLERLIQNAERF